MRIGCLRRALGPVALVAASLVAGCAVQTPETRTASIAPSMLVAVARAGVADGRGRFREIYCAVRDDHGRQLPFDRPCDGDAALWRMPSEPPPTGRSVALGRSTMGLTVVMVPGLLAECFRDESTEFGDARANLEAWGYHTDYIQTLGRQPSEVNATIIRDAIRAMPPHTRVVLVTHSKGTVDSLVALSAYPDLADKVVALVSVAGAVNGSPLSDHTPGWLADIMASTRILACEQGKGEETAASLRPSVRLAWFKTHAWPRSVRTYSLPAFALPENMSAELVPFYNDLAQTDPLNDGLVVASDAIVPRSTLLGYANADHVAVAMPFDASKSLFAATLMTHNDYPRAVLLEAAIRYVEEDLRAAGRRAPSEAAAADRTAPRR